MIAVGDQYNTLESCLIEGVSKVLEVMGGLLLFIAILYIMIGLSFCTAVECGTICAVASCPIIVVAAFAQFGVQIWASVVVFGKSLTQSRYCEVANRSMSWLVAHPRIFRLLMKGKIDTNCDYGTKGSKIE